jgi:hypothetical protein
MEDVLADGTIMLGICNKAENEKTENERSMGSRNVCGISLNLKENRSSQSPRRKPEALTYEK